MSDGDPALVSALRRQLARRPRGAARVGWKVGQGERESIDGGVVVGHLTSATLLQPGSVYGAGGRHLHVDCELALTVGNESTVTGYGVALEIVDLGSDDVRAAAVVADVFHRAVAFGPTRPEWSPGAEATLEVNGEVRRTQRVPEEAADRLGAVAGVLAAAGEGLRPGDRVITGSVVQERVELGDDAVAEIAGLGRVELRIR